MANEISNKIDFICENMGDLIQANLWLFDVLLSHSKRKGKLYNTYRFLTNNEPIKGHRLLEMSVRNPNVYINYLYTPLDNYGDYIQINLFRNGLFYGSTRILPRQWNTIVIKNGYSFIVNPFTNEEYTYLNVFQQITNDYKLVRCTDCNNIFRIDTNSNECICRRCENEH